MQNSIVIYDCIFSMSFYVKNLKLKKFQVKYFVIITFEIF